MQAKQRSSSIVIRYKYTEMRPDVKSSLIITRSHKFETHNIECKPTNDPPTFIDRLIVGT